MVMVVLQQGSVELRIKAVEIEERRLVAHVRWIIWRLHVLIWKIVELAIGILALLLSSALLASGIGKSCKHCQTPPHDLPV